MTFFHVAIIGCGLIGKKRADVVFNHPETSLKLVVDTNKEMAASLTEKYHCEASSDWKKATSSKEIDIIIIATPNQFAASIAIEALKQGKHILIEKPLGRNREESQKILDAASLRNPSPIIKTGFNHRFHAAIWKAKEMMDHGDIGEVFAIKASYGHGGRPGMEKEWRSSREVCGGGELLDQGVHIIDLIQWFSGEISEVYGRTPTMFWPIDVEDNAFVTLKTERNVTAFFHVSWTNWKNIFLFEIFGRTGYLAIKGLGGSYGPESLEWGKRKPEGGVPEIRTFQFSEPDPSWTFEWNEFINALKEKRNPMGNGNDGLLVNTVIEAIYKSSNKNEVILID